MKLMLNGKEVTGMGHYVMAGDIKDATAEDSNVLSGKSYYNNNGKREGTMPNRGGMSAELAAGGSVSIPEGYHNGEGVVRAQDLASQTQATAAAANIEAGYTAWVNGVEVEGELTPFSPSTCKMVKYMDVSGNSWTFDYVINTEKLYLITGCYFNHGLTNNIGGFPLAIYYKGKTDVTLYDGGFAQGVQTITLNSSGKLDCTRTVVMGGNNRYELWEIG